MDARTRRLVGMAGSILFAGLIGIVGAIGARAQQGAVGSTPIAPKVPPGAPLEANYLELARANVPANEQEWLMAERYLKLTREERIRFKVKNARTRKIELTAYSVCFYAKLKEGVGIKQSGEDCYWQLVGLN